ncbi:type II toxin-antitoxin system HipA family toxin [Agromyces seonyuensis]|uniref:Type II toxin-antitoxin system HipA family toxin n=1 Tax=Agromyces seonyuensis TaxID=2662446 RepID=A0A6I4P1I7_9MICO|nr:type II toxin-antitoxin system HipA family toxin [Agromyces seonyuensis]MWB97889.1 type II toxin-antitoxin system HipA family toxin [Agromyces seonyuensis]
MTLYDDLEVHVELEGATVLAGRAQFHRSRGSLTSTTFQYDRAYLERTKAYQLDPALPLVSGTQQTTGLPGAFADSAPDRWGRNLIKKRERTLARQESRRPRDFDDADYLAGVSDITRQGAIRYRPIDDPAAPFLDPGHDVPRLLRLPELLRAADAAASDDDDDFEAVKMLLAAGTGSLGGARPKATVLDENDRQLIAKFPHHEDAWDVMAWESTALDLAAAAGVRVAHHRLVRVDHRHALLLDRFDRDEHDHRIGYVSAMTMLEHRDGEHADYVDIAERLAEISARATDDAHQLFRRVAVSVGLNNTDDHLRNHGFLRARGGWTLSPAFDVNPNPGPELRQTTIAGADLPDDEADGLIELARACRLSPAEARAVLADVADTLALWRDVATGNDVPQSQLARFEDSFAAGLRTLREA